MIRTMPGRAANNPSPSGTGAAFGVRLASALLWVMAVLQGGVFLSTGTSENRVIGATVAAASCVLALWPMRPGRRLAGLALLGVVAIANFAMHLVSAGEPFEGRLLQTGVVYGYAALCVAGAGALACRRCAEGLLVSALVFAAGLVAAEAMVPTLWPAIEHRKTSPVRWIGSTIPDPVLEERYAPNTVLRTIYATNPRGYFRPGDPREARWRVSANPQTSTARLVLPGDSPEGSVRVEIDRAGDPTGWHIQLSQVGVQLKGGRNYVLAFQARADQPRTVSYQVGQAHPPWKGLGLHRDLKVGTEWSQHRESFIADQSEDEAHLVFNLGGSKVPFEVRAAELRSENGPSALRALPVEHSVTYRFNGKGCRGPDYVMPPPPNRKRILVLGDSYALGVGVHEEHTFSAQLQALLNADRPDAQAYDVINCGVSGYATRQERQHYEILAPVYRPDVVVLAMVVNDDTSWRSDVQNGYFHTPTKYERLFYLWTLMQYLRHEGRKPPPDFSGSLKEVLALRELCARNNAKLAVFVFRNHPLEFGWRDLVGTISRGLAGSGVPFLDTGERFLAGRNWQDLVVHAGGDLHPNEVGHRDAAEQVAALLKTNGIVP